MIHQSQKLLCVKCKTGLIVESAYKNEIIKYKLVFCPNCSTPIREIRTENDLHIKEINMD